jgi:predicted dienelactone hydrolase
MTVFLSVSILSAKEAFPQDTKKRIEYEKPGSYKVKFLEFPNLKDVGRKNRRVPLKIHFPAKGKHFPLVVFSHGGGGNWDSYIYQIQHLVSHGSNNERFQGNAGTPERRNLCH